MMSAGKTMNHNPTIAPMVMYVAVLMSSFSMSRAMCPPSLMFVSMYMNETTAPTRYANNRT